MGILGELWVKLGLKNDGLKKGLNESKGEVSKFSQMMGKLGGVIGAAFSVAAIIKFSKETSELANRMAGVRSAFEKIASPNLLNNLRKATRGTVDDLQLMQRAVQAKNFNIPLENLATYLEFATKRARETGQSVDYLVDSIVTGLGRQSVLILDNLGISAKEIRDRMKDGGSMADAVGEIIKKSMGEGAQEIDNAVLATERLSAAWTNLKIAIGENTGGIWNGLKGVLAAELEKATAILNSNSLNGWQKFFAFNPITGLLMKMSGTFDRAFDKDALKAAQDAMEAGPEVPNGFKYAKNQDGIPDEVEQRKGLIQILEDEIKKKTEIRDLSGNEQEIDSLNEEIKKLEEKLKLLKMTKEERVEYYKSQTPQIERVDGVFDLDSLKDNTQRGIDILEQGRQAWMQKGEELGEITLQQQAMINEAASMISNSLVAGVSGSLNELANVIAGVEGANVGSVVSALLSPLADACISAGLLIMTTGEGIETLRNSLTTFLGVGAIAAGAALMAVGFAAKTGLAAIGNGKRGSAAAISSGGYTSYTGGYGVNTNNYSQQNNDYRLTTTLKGQDLLLAIERTQNNRRR